MKNIFEKSQNFKEEYSCSIIRIGEITSIPNSDFIGQTLVNGLSIIIRKDDIKEGDVCIYAANETQLNENFLSANNLFNIECYEKNVNSPEVYKLIESGKKDEAKKMCGFFNKYGRVKIIKIKGISSMGILFKLDDVKKWKNINIDSLIPFIGTDFDVIDDELFVKAYVPPINNKCVSYKIHKNNKNIIKFNRIIPGTFDFHYDTYMLAKNMSIFSPDDDIVITNKLHGTSICLENILTNTPTFFLKRLIRKLIGKTPYIQKYDLVYSSRTIIKNKNINKKQKNNGFYDVDIWKKWAEMLKPYIPKDMKLYGEIVGYLNNSASMIQKGYDYGCKEGSNAFMPYRINMNNVEWSIKEVYHWTINLINNINNNIKKGDELNSDMIIPIKILYDGKFCDLYPEIKTDSEWNKNVLAKMKTDFGLEKIEPMCRIKVPREGIVLRKNISSDSNGCLKEAFKLKANAFLFKESNEIDNNYVDIEIKNNIY